jgi:hypothetical protein
LSALSDASLDNAAETTGDLGSTTLDTSTLASTGAGTTDISNLFGSGADDAFTLTGGDDIKAVDNVAVADDDAIVGGLTAASTDAGTKETENEAVVTTAPPVTGGLTQAQQELITANDPNNVSAAADTAVTGGLGQVSATGNTATSGTTGATGAGGSNISNILGSIIKKTIANATSGATKNLVKKAIAPKTTAMPTVTKKVTSGALNQMKSNLVPKKIDISKLTPVAKKTAPLKVDVSKLTPVSKISGLSSLVNRKG